MKKILLTLMCVALIGVCSSASAETVLSDEQLGELYAGLPFIVKPVVEQTNVAVLVADGHGMDGDIFGTGINQDNSTWVSGFIGAHHVAVAAGPQKNIASLLAKDGNIKGAYIGQNNTASVNGGVLATGLPGFWGIPGIPYSVKEQLNVAVLSANERMGMGYMGSYGMGQNGDIEHVNINQGNLAMVRGMISGTDTATAIGSQTNIAALWADDDIKDAKITQKNRACVSAMLFACGKTVAVGPQMNSSVLFADGSIACSRISQSNIAGVSSGLK